MNAVRPICGTAVRGKRVPVRADLNVPMHDGVNVPMHDGRITDATRITRLAEGIRPLRARGARLVSLTHFARPKPNVRAFAFPVDKLRRVLAGCRKVLWNGPPGAFGMQPLDQSTRQPAETAAAPTRGGLAVSVADDFTCVSSAGGAFLEWLEGRTPPGIAALQTAAAAA